jgi:AAA15 family ATPase/GTPase
MKKIAIKNFKAYKHTNKEFEIDLQEKHLLLYGDNGAGKSSLYEALKVAFCKDKLEPDIPPEKTPEEKTVSSYCYSLFRYFIL